MSILRNLPIQRKLTVIVLLSSCLALLLACIAFVTYEQMTFRRAMVRNLSTTAEMIGVNSTAAIAFDDAASAEETLKSLRAEPHILFGCLYTKDGKPFAIYERSDLKRRPVIPLARADGHLFDRNQLGLHRQIQRAGEAVGTIYVASDLQEMNERFARYAVIVALVLVTSLLAAFLLASRLQKIITQPVFHLAEIAATVATKRDYSVRAVKQGRDELGQLIDGFNEMLTQIQKQDSALQEARDTLEKRVEERTGELQLEVVERKQAEAALRASEERIRLIVDTAFDAIVTCDTEGKILEWNEQAKNTFGWTRSQAHGKNLTETILPPQHHEAHLQGIQRFLRTGEGPFLNKRVEATASTNTGRIIPVELAMSPVKFDGVLICSAFLRDITDQKEAQARLEEAHKQLLTASRQAGMAEVATGVLHNVGNVLNSVNVAATIITESAKKSKVGNVAKIAELLREHAADLGAYLANDPKGKQLPEYIGHLGDHLLAEQATMLKESDLLRANIEHIKDIVAMQQSYAKVSGVTEVVDLAGLAEDALRMNEAALQRHGVRIVRQFEDVPPLAVEKHKVLQILVNLIRNAKYACTEAERTDKHVIIRAANGNGRVKISVIDNGVGIPRENLTRIFNHGFTTRKDGHGFGLHSGALAAKEMGGSLSAYSEGGGRGATFTLELPLQKAPP